MSQECRKLLSLLLCVAMLAMLMPQVQLPAFADYNVSAFRSALARNAIETSLTVAEGTCGDNAWWNLDDYGTLFIGGSGTMKHYGSASSAPWSTYGDSIKTVQIGDGITSIGEQAFYCLNNLTDVTIPDSVTSIGYQAFYSCGSLTNITIPESVTKIGSGAFSYCSSLTDINIPKGVTVISANVFTSCSSLTGITIPEGVTTINSGAFSYCSSLTSIIIPDGVTSIGTQTFYNCNGLTSIIIPESVTKIGYESFRGCSSLTGITIPESVTSIGTKTFYNCSSLTSITIPAGVTKIDYEAFRGCSSLTGIIIPEGVLSIESYTFDSCYNLTSITIPKSVTSINKRAFYNCRNLKDVYYTGTETQWNSISITADNTPLTTATIHYNHVVMPGSMKVYADRTDLRMAVGDRITLRAGIMTEDGSYIDPSGITFQVTDGSLADIEASGFAEDCIYVRLRGVNPGTTTVTFSDSKSGCVVSIPVTVFENSYPAYTLNNIPEISAFGRTANFANFSGLYIDCCKYQLQNDQSVRLTFDVYNTNYCYGLIEVYQADGQLYNLVLIDKMVDCNTGIKEVYVDGGVCLIQTAVNHSFNDYRSAFVSKHTPVELDIPRNGYIKITCDPLQSDAVALVNYCHLILSALSLVGKVNDFDQADTDVPEALIKNLMKDTALAQFKKDGSGIFAKIMMDEVKELTITSKTVGSFIDTVSQQMIDFQGMELIAKSLEDSGIGFAENVFIEMTGIYGIALKTIFVTGECKNLALSYNDVAYTIGGGEITILNQGGGLRAATEIKLESEVDFDPDVALQAYCVEMDEEFLQFVKQADQETYDILTESICHTYNISLLKNEEKVQHSDYVTVYIPIPEDLRALALDENVTVYRIEEDGSLTDMNAVVEDGCMRFVTNHFSLYVLSGEAGYLLGDITGEGKVNMGDVAKLYAHIKGTSILTEETGLDRCDITGEGKVNMGDVAKLYAHIKGTTKLY